MILTVIEILAVWLACCMVNLFWYKHYPDVMAREFHPALIVLAPLATFFVSPA